MLRSAASRATTLAAAMMITAAMPAVAQNPPTAQSPSSDSVPPEHDMSKMDMPMDSPGGWHLMQDGALNLLYNQQGGPRGGREFIAPNWWMGMGTRHVGRGDLTLTGMVSLDPATVGSEGYRELFQVGEAYNGRPVTDRQHPHDAWMQLSAAWRTMIAGSTGLTFAGGISGEPALGPIAFMHRASAAALPLAPIAHHTFDSTHVAFGVATVGIDRGKFAVEGSVFNGREPDQHRWDFDFGRMDSVSGRLWFRPASSWELQVSTGRLVDPEQLHPGNVIRTTTSASYTSGDDAHLRAMTIGFGMNRTDEVTRHAAFAEGTHAWGGTIVSGRVEFVQVESELLALQAVPDSPEGEARRDVVGAFTLGAQRDLRTWKRITASLGASGSLYRVPDVLRETHGSHPASFQLFVQLRPAAGSMGRMWNMRMGGPPMGSMSGMMHHH